MAESWLAVWSWWCKAAYPAKTTGESQVTGHFLICPELDSNPASGERQRVAMSTSWTTYDDNDDDDDDDE